MCCRAIRATHSVADKRPLCQLSSKRLKDNCLDGNWQSGLLSSTHRWIKNIASLSGCSSIHTYIYMHVYAYIYTYTYIRIHIHIHIHIYVCIYIYTYIHVFIYILYIYMCVCVSVCVSVCMYVYQCQHSGFTPNP